MQLACPVQYSETETEVYKAYVSSTKKEETIRPLLINPLKM